MDRRNKFILAFASLWVFTVSAPAPAGTVTEKTIVTQKELSNVQKINFDAFDLNKDNILSMAEVGEKLFYIFDTDGNEVIDNVEFERKQVMTIIPMEKRTFIFSDYDDDGHAESSSYTYESFIQQSQLMRFDKDRDGLSPADFIGMSFLELDDDKSKAIELQEWKEEYIAKVFPSSAEQERYNN